MGKKSLEDDSSDENPVVNGFEIVDMGSDENNCLLLSMELGVLSSAIRDDVKEFEKKSYSLWRSAKMRKNKRGWYVNSANCFSCFKENGVWKSCLDFRSRG